MSARVTRAMREKMRSDFAEERHPGRARRRELLAEASRLANEDRKARFPVLTADNFEAADTYQRERIEHHRGRLGVTDADIRAAEAREDAYTPEQLRVAWRDVRREQRALGGRS